MKASPKIGQYLIRQKCLTFNAVIMKKKRFSPEQISKVLKSYDDGTSIQDLMRDHGFSRATFYKWRERYAGMDAKDLKRLKELEAENRRLKQMYSELALDHEVAKAIIKKL